MKVFRPPDCLNCSLCEVLRTWASWQSRRGITNSVAAPDRVWSQWDDQRAEKAIKGVCPSVSGRLNTKNDLSLRWTGRVTDPPLFITRLLSYLLDDWTVSPLSREPNLATSERKNSASHSTAGHSYVRYWWFFFSFLLSRLFCAQRVLNRKRL